MTPDRQQPADQTNKLAKKDTDLIFMRVFAIHCARIPLLMTHNRDVDEHARLDINPAGIDDIQLVRGRTIGVTGIDLQHVVLPSPHTLGSICVDRHVVVCGKKVHRVQGNLDIDVGIPWHDLSDSQTIVLVHHLDT